jgi:hypothetical protein
MAKNLSVGIRHRNESEAKEGARRGGRAMKIINQRKRQ